MEKAMFRGCAEISARRRVMPRVVTKPSGRPRAASTLVERMRRPARSYDPNRSLGGNGRRSPGLLHEEHQELGRFGSAGVPGNAMDIVGRLIERLAGSERHWVAALHLHHHRTFQ